MGKQSNKAFYKDAFLWGFILWLIGYALGIVLFPFVPAAMIGWVISPIGIIITVLVLFKKIHGSDLDYYLALAMVWVAMAVFLDYFLLVRLFSPADGYYKLDVYLYYALTFALPVAVGWVKNRRGQKKEK
jgi:hypothetical protein